MPDELSEGINTTRLIRTFQPRWTNLHALECPVTKQRSDLWKSFISDPTNGALHGAVIEYDDGGDQEVENCECHVYGKYVKLPGEHHTGAELWNDARALALAIDGFVVRVAQDTNTHDGKPRGSEWSEGPDEARASEMRVWSLRLRALADLWEDG